MKQIAVMGSGSWGTALALLLHKNGHHVNLWSFTKEENEILKETRENLKYLPGVLIPNQIGLTHNIEEAVKNADAIVIAIPSRFMRDNILAFAPYIKKEQIIVNVSKGLEEETLLRLSEVIQEILPDNPIAVLSGPSHAEELARDIPTTCVVASVSLRTSEIVQDIFMSPKFRVYTNSDIIGVELGGALKNVMALAAGISDGLGFGDNTKAALMTRGIVEITRLGLAMGAQLQTFSGLSGIGDLIVTCTSLHSRNRRAGILIGQGKSLEETLQEIHMVVEGVHTAKAALAFCKKYEVEMPIVQEINKVLFESKNPKKAVVDLMMRSRTEEQDITHL
ncbi:MAG: NAD(P)H-dependent glycerol-3-phosphate dehydrogenase [Epulopiscium sp.]|nr:NAD(P)H-dependent glycerol-3-phosphate dehydrogenase [Candidatus Epulonipiscium sp.]